MALFIDIIHERIKWSFEAHHLMNQQKMCKMYFCSFLLQQQCDWIVQRRKSFLITLIFGCCSPSLCFFSLCPFSSLSSRFSSPLSRTRNWKFFLHKHEVLPSIGFLSAALSHANEKNCVSISCNFCVDICCWSWVNKQCQPFIELKTETVNVNKRKLHKNYKSFNLVQYLFKSKLKHDEFGMEMSFLVHIYVLSEPYGKI